MLVREDLRVACLIEWLEDSKFPRSPKRSPQMSMAIANPDMAKELARCQTWGYVI